MFQEFAGRVDLAFVARVEYGDGIATEHFDDFHAGDVGGPVAEIDHMAEGDGLVILFLAFIDLGIVADVHDALGDLEQELGLAGVVDGDGGPYGHAVLIIPEGAGEDLLEFIGDAGAFDEFGLAR